MDYFKGKKNRFITIGFLLLLTIGMYAPFLGNGFTTDDFIHIWHLKSAENILLTSPFGFYRPMVTLSFYLNYKMSGLNALPYRLTNMIFHSLIVFLLFRFIEVYTRDRRVAFFSVLSFIMTPKAHSIAVNWVSGRTELLMALFLILCLINWIKYESTNKKVYFILCLLFYSLALMSKENSALIPLLLFFTSKNWNFSKRKVFLMFLLFFVFGLLMLIRYFAALMPFSANEHYNLLISFSIVIKNLANYFLRSIPTVVLLLLCVALPLFISSFRTRVFKSRFKILSRDVKPILYSIVWFIVFILPVLHIKMRSELYLYIVGVGFCILIADIIVGLLDRIMPHIKKVGILIPVGLVIYIMISGVYITERNMRFNRISTFSHKFIKEMPRQLKLSEKYNFVYIIPGDKHVEKLLKDSFHGYFDIIVKLIYKRENIGGRMWYDGKFNHVNEKKIFIVNYKNQKIYFSRVDNIPRLDK